MQQVDLIVKNGTVLTMDSENNIIHNGLVCVMGDIITYVGKDENKDAYKAEKIIDAKEGLILPGLINGHTKTAMSLLRGLGDDISLKEKLSKYINCSISHFGIFGVQIIDDE